MKQSYDIPNTNKIEQALAIVNKYKDQKYSSLDTPEQQPQFQSTVTVKMGQFQEMVTRDNKEKQSGAEDRQTLKIMDKYSAQRRTEEKKKLSNDSAPKRKFYSSRNDAAPTTGRTVAPELVISVEPENDFGQNSFSRNNLLSRKVSEKQ